MRKLIWSGASTKVGWTCSECDWVLNPKDAPVGNTLREMEESFERSGAKAFEAHVCAEHPRKKDKEPK
jgi:hypothetical protein